MTNEDKMSKFTEAVLADAEQEKQHIMEQLEEEKAQRLKKAEEDILKEAFDFIQHEVAQIKISTGKELSLRNLEIRKELLNRRNKLTMQVFDKVRDRIKEYCTKDQYKEDLSEIIAGSVNELGADGTVILCRNEDSAIINDIVKEKGFNIAVQTDTTIKLGGLRFANEAKGLLIDETFDSKYNEQLSKFEETSGLIIT